MYFDDKKELAIKLRDFSHGDDKYMKITRLEAKALSDAMFQELHPR